MKNNFKNIFIIFLIALTLGNAALKAQNSDTGRKQLSDLESVYVHEQAKLDSLKNELNKAVSAADKAKAAKEVSQAQVSNLLARALEIGRQHDNQQKKVSELTSQIQKLRRRMYHIYSTRIDSLNMLLNKENNSEKRAVLQNEMKELNTQRLRVSPVLPMFSFDPGLINKIPGNKSADATGKSIYNEYLVNAMSEVDSNLSVLQTKSQEVRSMMRLNQRAREFVEDINDRQTFSMLQLQNEKTTSYASETSSLKNDVFRGVNEIQVIYNQLEPVLSEHYNLPKISEPDSILSDEYLQLLENAETTLKLYREMLKDKLTQ